MNGLTRAILRRTARHAVRTMKIPDRWTLAVAAVEVTIKVERFDSKFRPCAWEWRVRYVDIHGKYPYDREGKLRWFRYGHEGTVYQTVRSRAKAVEQAGLVRQVLQARLPAINQAIADCALWQLEQEALKELTSA